MTRLCREAAARGAPAHWLGHIGVDDLESAARAFVERGATPLGPARPTDDGGQIAILIPAAPSLRSRLRRPPPRASTWSGMSSTRMTSLAR